jgi:hypothetical protein
LQGNGAETEKKEVGLEQDLKKETRELLTKMKRYYLNLHRDLAKKCKANGRRCRPFKKASLMVDLPRIIGNCKIALLEIDGENCSSVADFLCDLAKESGELRPRLTENTLDLKLNPGFASQMSVEVTDSEVWNLEMRLREAAQQQAETLASFAEV